MKNKWTIPGIIVAAVVIIGGLIASSYNGLVTSRETVKKSFGDVQSAYQRRNDLVPNLVNIVKGSSSFEQDTLTAVVEARAKATSITVDPTTATPEQLNAFANAQNGVASSLGKLLAVVENYPDIKSTQAYQDLMVQLEGTENRINVTRNDFNKAAQDYNTKRQRFPTSLVAGMFGFKEYNYFQASTGAETAPTISFD